MFNLVEGGSMFNLVVLFHYFFSNVIYNQGILNFLQSSIWSSFFTISFLILICNQNILSTTMDDLIIQLLLLSRGKAGTS